MHSPNRCPARATLACRRPVSSQDLPRIPPGHFRVPAPRDRKGPPSPYRPPPEAPPPAEPPAAPRPPAPAAPPAPAPLPALPALPALLPDVPADPAVPVP